MTMELLFRFLTGQIEIPTVLILTLAVGCPRLCHASEVDYDNHLSLKVIKSCPSYIQFDWGEHKPPLLPDQFYCDASYHTINATMAQVVENLYLQYGMPFSISALQNGTAYMFFLLCWAGTKKFRSKMMSLRTGSHCNETHVQLQQISTRKTTYSPVYFKDEKAIMSSPVEIAASTVLGLVALVMLIICAVYLWKRYRRRQIRIFLLSNEDSDPERTQFIFRGSDQDVS